MKSIMRHEQKMMQLANANGELSAMVNSTHPANKNNIQLFKTEYKALKSTFQGFLEELI